MQYAHPLPNPVKIRKTNLIEWERVWAEKERRPVHPVDQGKKPNILLITNYSNSI